MQEKLVLISDEPDFFEYIIPKLSLRKSDELYRFKFSELPEKIHLLNSSLMIINSENNQEQTLQLLSLIESAPAIVFGYNDDESFKIKAYKSGMFDYFSLSTSDEEIRAKLLPALKWISSIKRNNLYRDILVKNKILTKNNEVFLDSNNILEREIELINKSSAYAVLLAISPDEDSKFTIQQNQIETIILNNIRKNDILINFAPNKYFLLLKDIDLESAKKLWNQISKNFTESIYAGMGFIGHKSRQQIVSEVLNNLHLSINKGYNSSKTASVYNGDNFVQYRNEFKKKLNQIISPVFYHTQQIYNEKLFEMRINIDIEDDVSYFIINSKDSKAILKITSPGYTAVNIDMEYQRYSKIIDTKHITLEPDDLEPGLLHDLLEQFVLEFKKGV